MHFSKTFPKALLILLLVFGFLFIGAQPAYADISCSPLFFIDCILDLIPGAPSIPDPISAALSGIAGGIVKLFSFLIIGLIGVIGSVFFGIAGELVKVALNLNSNIADLSPVQLGYDVILGIANMGFIVALVVIAFGTMFRSDAFGYKKALPKIVIAALLINFGFFIVTKWLIAPVDQVTASLNDAASFDVASFKRTFEIEGALINSFGDLSFTDPRKNVSEMGKAIATTLFVATFIFVGTIALLAFAIMLAIRAIALVLLIILLPLAWAGLIFPNLKIPGGGNPWRTWWEQFTKWLLFAPFAMFFFWLAVKFPSTGSAQALDASNSFLDASFQMIVVVGLMLGGLYVSNRMGITGAAVALGAVTAGRVWAQGKAKKYGRKAGYETLKRAFPRERLQTLEKVGAKRGFMARHLTAPIRAAGRRAGITTTALTSAREVEFRKKIEGLEPFQISDMYSGLNEEERAYALKYMIEKGYDWELAEGARDDILNWANKGYFDKNMYGLKKAELDLIDTGISPDAIAAQAKYKGKLRGAYKEFKEAKAEGAPKEELQAKLKEMRRIKYEGQEETKEALYKNLNVVPASGFAKFQRRMMSAPKFNAEKGIWETPYAMYSGSAEDKNDFLEMQGMLVDYMHEKRPAAINRMRGALRGDGTARMSRGTQEHVPKFLESFVDPLLEAHERMTGEKLTREEFAKQREQQLQRFTDYWHNIQEYQLAEAERYANEQARRQGTTKEEIDAIKSRILEKKQTEIRQMTPGEIAGYYQQLLLATRGSVNLAYAG